MESLCNVEKQGLEVASSFAFDLQTACTEDCRSPTLTDVTHMRSYLNLYMYYTSTVHVRTHVLYIQNSQHAKLNSYTSTDTNGTCILYTTEQFILIYTVKVKIVLQ